MQRVAIRAALRYVDLWCGLLPPGAVASAAKSSLHRDALNFALALEMRGPRTQSSPLAAARIMSSILTRISWADLRSSGVMPIVLPA
jgi:hypothetical protein